MPDTGIMIVEDDPQSLNLLERRLSKMGYNVIATASTGEEALEKAESNDPEIVLMDIRLRGEMDGIQTAHIFYHVMEIPVIYLTAYMDEDLLERAKSTMPFGYLIKPVSKEQLRSNIELALHNNQSVKKKRLEKGVESIQNAQDLIVVTNLEGNIKFMNPAASEVLGDKVQFQNKPIIELFLNDSSPEHEPFFIFYHDEQHKTLYQSKISPMIDNDQNVLGTVLVFKDMGIELKEVDNESIQNHIIKKMKNSKGLVSTCSVCKKIKDKKGEWVSFETYFKKFAKLKVSHGFCPDCINELFSELYANEKKEEK